MLDRIDLHAEVPRVAREELGPDTPPDGETSAVVATRVDAARERQLVRGHKPNARLNTREINKHCKPDAAGQQLLERAMEQLRLSARAYHRILKVARTIADFAGSEIVMSAHVAEAVGYRVLDRQKGMN